MPSRTPLTARSDAELVAAAQAGDDDALEALLGRYQRFARARATRYFLVGGDTDDVEQEALIGLYEAVRDFRAEHGVGFRAFAEVCITRQVLGAVRAANRHKHRPLNTSVPLHGTAGDDVDEAGPTLEERLAPRVDADGPVDRLLGDEQVGVLTDAVATQLSELEVRVLHLYVAGRSYVEIADRVGRHTKAVDNAVQRIKRKLGRSLAAYELASAV